MQCPANNDDGYDEEDDEEKEMDERANSILFYSILTSRFRKKVGQMGSTSTFSG
jgi:hypothetical protein